MSSNQSKAYGFGVATQTTSGQILDCSFYSLGLGDAPVNKSDKDFDKLLGEDSIRKVRKVAIEIKINLTEKPKDASDVYLRLHLLSHRLVKPHGLNLDGIFGLLSNVVWTSAGACEVEGFSIVRTQLQNKFGNLVVYGVDKFPRMIDYVIPEGVRIADGDRVRLGAYLSAGTTVMHEGFVNFNAGTLGKSMVEGRISAGVVVGDGSDIGGGASIMGTLSGGGTEVISIGKRTLLGANSGIGISLGDDCVVEAGVYITAGSKITLPDGEILKAKELSGANNLLFRRNSQSGALEVVSKSGKWNGLNAALHNN
jgi:2,3,4,5-tetrahydropyridine-2-carboxylate N-succinyltransferase